MIKDKHKRTPFSRHRPKIGLLRNQTFTFESPHPLSECRSRIIARLDNEPALRGYVTSSDSYHAQFQLDYGVGPSSGSHARITGTLAQIGQVTHVSTRAHTPWIHLLAMSLVWLIFFVFLETFFIRPFLPNTSIFNNVLVILLGMGLTLIVMPLVFLSVERKLQRLAAWLFTTLTAREHIENLPFELDLPTALLNAGKYRESPIDQDDETHDAPHVAKSADAVISHAAAPSVDKRD